jgi:hypothetical protein
VSIGCLLGAFWVSVKCLLSTRCVSIERLLGVCLVPVGCLLSAGWVSGQEFVELFVFEVQFGSKNCRSGWTWGSWGLEGKYFNLD